MVFDSLKFYRVCEIANRLRVNEDFIMELLNEGILEGINLGNRGVWIVEERAILEFLCEFSNSIGKGNSLCLSEDSFSDCSVVVNKGDQVRCKGKEVVIEGLDNASVVSDLGESEVVVLKSHVVRKEDENSKFVNGGVVVSEFVFDKLQAAKPISDELAISSDLVQQESKSILKTRGEGPLKCCDSSNDNVHSNVYGRVKRNFIISKFLSEQLQRVKDILGESMSSIVECALRLYFESKGFVSEHNFKG